MKRTGVSKLVLVKVSVQRRTGMFEEEDFDLFEENWGV